MAPRDVIPDTLIPRVTDYVRAYMSNYDASHDFNHIQRVVRLAQHIHACEAASWSSSSRAPADPAVVTLAALLHDVGDKKYLREGEDHETMVRDVLRGFGADEELAGRIQTVCLGVSYSSEVRDPERVRSLIEEHPELAIVQDADRLDAIGAVGIARTFAFGGAKDRPMEDTIQHFGDKLLRLESMMKTDTGRALARERTEKLQKFKEWWEEETVVAQDN